MITRGSSIFTSTGGYDRQKPKEKSTRTTDSQTAYRTRINRLAALSEAERKDALDKMRTYLRNISGRQIATRDWKTLVRVYTDQYHKK